MTAPLRVRDERGFALSSSIVALTVFGLMVAGVFFLAVADQRQAQGTLSITRTSAGAESGLARLAEAVVGGSDGTELNGQVTGVLFSARLVRPGSNFGFITSSASDQAMQARRAVGVLLEFRPPVWEARAALTVAGTITGAPANLAVVRPPGNDAGCGPAPDSVAGLIMSDPDNLAVAGCDNCFRGDPAILVDTAVAAELNSPRVAQLARLADHLLPGGTRLVRPRPVYQADGDCNIADPSNWGDPGGGGSCAAFFPIVHSDGNLNVSGGEGQGILIVEGDLDISSRFRFSGLVIVRGKLTFADSGPEIKGQVVAGSIGFPQNSGFSRPFVVFSTCAVERTLDRHRTPGLLGERSWFSLN